MGHPEGLLSSLLLLLSGMGSSVGFRANLGAGASLTKGSSLSHTWKSRGVSKEVVNMLILLNILDHLTPTYSKSPTESPLPSSAVVMRCKHPGVCRVRSWASASMAKLQEDNLTVGSSMIPNIVVPKSYYSCSIIGLAYNYLKVINGSV